MLTEKQKNFCREYFSNGGNGTQAYLSAYNSESEVAASIESSRLLKREDIQQFLFSLNKPLDDIAINERERKRKLIWERIDYCITTNNDAAVARYMDILNKMDSEYVNITKSIDESPTNITTLDTETLRRISKSGA